MNPLRQEITLYICFVVEKYKYKLYIDLHLSHQLPLVKKILPLSRKNTFKRAFKQDNIMESVLSTKPKEDKEEEILQV